MPNPPNAERRRPSRSYSLPREQVEWLDEVADRTGRKRSNVLEDVINFVMRAPSRDIYRPILRGSGVEEGRDVGLS